jgi:hypothetical protein
MKQSSRRRAWLLGPLSTLLLVAAPHNPTQTGTVTISANAQQCIRIFSVAKQGTVGARNTCNECKVAVMNFYYSDRNGTRQETKHFNINAKSQREIDIRGTSSTRLLDETDCVRGRVLPDKE